MMQTLLVRSALALGLMMLVACGDDDDGGGGGGAGCARVQELCADEPDTEVDCSQGEPSASANECIASATTCDAAFVCLLGDLSGAAGAGD